MLSAHYYRCVHTHTHTLSLCIARKYFLKKCCTSSCYTRVNSLDFVNCCHFLTFFFIKKKTANIQYLSWDCLPCRIFHVYIYQCCGNVFYRLYHIKKNVALFARKNIKPLVNFSFKTLSFCFVVGRGSFLKDDFVFVPPLV